MRIGGVSQRAGTCYANGPYAAGRQVEIGMRIAHVNLASGFRGGERQTELLARELARSDYEQVLVARRDGDLARRLRDTNIEIREVRSTPWSAARAMHDVDLVHVHEGRSIYAAYFRSLVSGTPYVVTRRVNNPIGTHWLARRAYRRASRVVGVSEDIAGILADYDPQIRAGAVRSASSGFEVDGDESARIRARYPGKFIVGHVGALDSVQKAQEYIIQVAWELQKANPQVQFVLVGGGSDEAMFRTLAAGLQNLAFTGFVDNVGDYLAAFDLFILPSNKEGIGGILLDAMDQGLAIVASRVGGVPEIVHDGENGILIEPARPDQLQAAILKLMGSPQLRQQFGDRGRQISRDYTATAMSRRYEALYKSILDS